MLILKLLYKNPIKLSARKIEIIQTIISENYPIYNYLNKFLSAIYLNWNSHLWSMHLNRWIYTYAWSFFYRKLYFPLLYFVPLHLKHFCLEKWKSVAVIKNLCLHRTNKLFLNSIYVDIFSSQTTKELLLCLKTKFLALILCDGGKYYLGIVGAFDHQINLTIVEIAQSKNVKTRK